VGVIANSSALPTLAVSMSVLSREPGVGELGLGSAGFGTGGGGSGGAE
jgi:hypothetical protein